MTYKEKTEWLARYQTALRRERFLEEELQSLRSDAERVTACFSGMPGSGAKADRLPRAVERMEKARQQLEKQLQTCVACRYEVVQAVAAVTNPAGQEVLRRRYILGQSYPEIADAMGLVERRVYQLHRSGLQMLEPEKTSGMLQ